MLFFLWKRNKEETSSKNKILHLINKNNLYTFTINNLSPIIRFFEAIVHIHRSNH